MSERISILAVLTGSIVLVVGGPVEAADPPIYTAPSDVQTGSEDITPPYNPTIPSTECPLDLDESECGGDESCRETLCEGVAGCAWDHDCTGRTETSCGNRIYCDRQYTFADNVCDTSNTVCTTGDDCPPGEACVQSAGDPAYTGCIRAGARCTNTLLDYSDTLVHPRFDPAVGHLDEVCWDIKVTLDRDMSLTTQNFDQPRCADNQSACTNNDNCKTCDSGDHDGDRCTSNSQCWTCSDKGDDCTSDSDCKTCSNDGDRCDSNFDCGGFCATDPGLSKRSCSFSSNCKLCSGGTNDGETCSVNADCPDDGEENPGSCSSSGVTCQLYTCDSVAFCDNGAICESVVECEGCYLSAAQDVVEVGGILLSSPGHTNRIQINNELQNPPPLYNATPGKICDGNPELQCTTNTDCGSDGPCVQTSFYDLNAESSPLHVGHPMGWIEVIDDPADDRIKTYTHSLNTPEPKLRQIKDQSCDENLVCTGEVGATGTGTLFGNQICVKKTDQICVDQFTNEPCTSGAANCYCTNPIDSYVEGDGDGEDIFNVYFQIFDVAWQAAAFYEGPKCSGTDGQDYTITSKSAGLDFGYESTVIYKYTKYTNGEACTTDGQCESGNCVDGVCCNTACNGGGSDCQSCSLNGSMGTCTYLSAGATCDSDDDLCGSEETCAGGANTCNDNGPVECDTPDPICGGGTVCNPATGACDPNPPAAAEGTACDADNDACSLDECDDAGECVNESGVSCSPAPHPTCGGGKVCDVNTGSCVNNPFEAGSGTSCEADNSLCTIDECDGDGTCEKVNEVSCAAPDDCDGGKACNPGTGTCEDMPDQEAGTACNNDGDFCTIGACDDGGLCVNYDVVTYDPAPHPVCGGGLVCDPPTGNSKPNPPAAAVGTSCEGDGNLCTTDQCDANGDCMTTSVEDCDPNQPEPDCGGGQVCNPATGSCVPNPFEAEQGTSCDRDDDKCTIDECNGSGGCQQVSSVQCQAPFPPCESGAECNSASGLCEDLADAPYLTDCELDGENCTDDRCDGDGNCIFYFEADDCCGDADNTCFHSESCSTCPGDCGSCSSRCGNDVCDAGEDCISCRADCGDCASTCWDGVCSGLEDCLNCPIDCAACSSACGDGYCAPDENCDSCRADCGDCDAGCGDGRCADTESCDSCSIDCGACAAVCTDGTCDLGEDCISCTSDCGKCAQTCGDGTCGAGEHCRNCPLDCGRCPSFCGDGACTGFETRRTCSEDCGPLVDPRGACGNGRCGKHEDCNTCPDDCGFCLPECGDAICQLSEDCNRCPADCGPCTPTCRDFVCSPGEHCSNCPRDCGTCPIDL